MDFTRARALNTALSEASNSWGRGPFFTANPDALSELVSAMAYAIGEASPAYVSARVPSDGEPQMLQATVLTESLLINGMWDPADGVRIVVRPLDVEKIEITSAPNYLRNTDPWQDSAPVEVTITVGDRSYALPAPDATAASREALEAYLPKLIHSSSVRQYDH